eukprot:3111979-Amphidinium_carterae.1
MWEKVTLYIRELSPASFGGCCDGGFCAICTSSGVWSVVRKDCVGICHCTRYSGTSFENRLVQEVWINFRPSARVVVSSLQTCFVPGAL